jgi:hypothetical protein
MKPKRSVFEFGKACGNAEKTNSRRLYSGIMMDAERTACPQGQGLKALEVPRRELKGACQSRCHGTVTVRALHRGGRMVLKTQVKKCLYLSLTQVIWRYQGNVANSCFKISGEGAVGGQVFIVPVCLVFPSRSAFLGRLCLLL